MGGHYERDIFKQLEEVMLKCDNLSAELSNSKKEFERKIREQKINLESEFAKERKILQNRITELETEAAELRAENKMLREDNERMKRILNNDSSNSSLPPSADNKSKRANTYNLRNKSDKNVGGQKGHIGKTLLKADVEEKIEKGILKHKVVEIGKKGASYISKYVIDLEVIPTVTELRYYADETGKYNIPEMHRSDVTYGNTIKAMAVYLYSIGAMSNDRICDFINEISENKTALSTGSVYGQCKAFSEKSKSEIEKITDELLNAKTIYTDAAVVSVNGRQTYIRNKSTEKAVLYSAAQKKDLKTLKSDKVLSRYTGNLVHDHETTLYNFGNKHGECIVHLLRYLKKNTEETGNEWSKEIGDWFCKLNKQRKECIAENKKFSDETLKEYSKAYDSFIEKGETEHEKTKGKYAKKEEKRLLNRLKKYKENHLLFLYDFSIGFENNMSERDLRKCKNRQKIAGGFRKNSGNEIYCNILSIIETLKRKKMNIFENIIKVFTSTPIFE